MHGRMDANIIQAERERHTFTRQRAIPTLYLPEIQRQRVNKSTPRVFTPPLTTGQIVCFDARVVKQNAAGRVQVGPGRKLTEEASQ